MVNKTAKEWEGTRPDKDKQALVSENDRYPNFRDNGELFLVRCFACNPEIGKENYAPIVAKGICAWCGWKEDAETSVKDKGQLNKDR